MPRPDVLGRNGTYAGMRKYQSRVGTFTYAADPDGRDVPLGSHTRRMNPRDTKLAILTDVSVHRIIRRSTAYGAPYDPDAISPQADETPRGLYFIFLSAKAMATLEFLQQDPCPA
jgi:deferrochelatase/peroxidase EfeB